VVYEILENIDPLWRIEYLLGVFEFGHMIRDEWAIQEPTIRDLKWLDRNLNTVLVIDRTKNYYLQPENVLVIPELNWPRDPEDTDLYDITPLVIRLLELTLIKMDIRPILMRYDSVDPPRIMRRVMGRPRTTLKDPITKDFDIDVQGTLDYN